MIGGGAGGRVTPFSRPPTVPRNPDRNRLRRCRPARSARRRAGARRFCLACGRPLGSDEPTESRRQVTILFADLARSTELAHQLDAEGLHRVLGEYYETARATSAATAAISRSSSATP